MFKTSIKSCTLIYRQIHIYINIISWWKKTKFNLQNILVIHPPNCETLKSNGRWEKSKVIVYVYIIWLTQYFHENIDKIRVFQVIIYIKLYQIEEIHNKSIQFGNCFGWLQFEIFWHQSELPHLYVIFYFRKMLPNIYFFVFDFQYFLWQPFVMLEI